MMIVRPMRKRMLPIASMARSKKRISPPVRKKMPVLGDGVRWYVLKGEGRRMVERVGRGTNRLSRRLHRLL